LSFRVLRATARVAAITLVAGAIGCAAAVAAHGAPRSAESCTPRPLSASALARVQTALRARTDVWGERLLRAPGGPTYAATRRYLPPLLFARGPRRRLVTASGAYYLPFTLPPWSVGGPRGYALHVADGSEIVTRRIHGRSLSV
jgi:hypothetical protein